MDVIENCPHTDENENVAPRKRKLAVSHHSNNMMLQFDPNGNTRTFVRLSSLSEDQTNNSDEQEIADDTVEDETVSRDSILWENTVLQQIQSLIKNVQVSDSLADCISRELLQTNGRSDMNANIGPKTRRNSCFNLTSNGHVQRTRRQSVTAIHQQKSQSLPRRKISSAGIDNGFPRSRRASVTNMNGRRSSIVHGSGRRQSISNQSVSRRRSSIAHPNIAGSMSRPDGRRNSMVHCYNRRGSLAHAYQNSAMPSVRRKSAFSNDNVVSGLINPSLQRRRSSVKPPCFPVTKIASVQKRINKIYRRRRRQDRAEVNIADVRKAFKCIRRRENGEESDSKCSDSGTISKHESENEYVDENSNICDDGDGNINGTNLRSEYNAENNENNVTSEAVEDTPEEKDIDEKSTPRRKTSIQVRSWELSRRLRQRRREKRKGFTESQLI